MGNLFYQNHDWVEIGFWKIKHGVQKKKTPKTSLKSPNNEHVDLKLVTQQKRKSK